MSLTHDEALTFARYVPYPIWQIVKYDMPHLDPNNHILNTLLTKLSTSVFGTQEWALRLPNSLAFLVYLLIAISFSSNQRIIANREKSFFMTLGFVAFESK